jgi:hypothetical protein
MIKPNELFIGAVVNYEIGGLIEPYIIDATDLMWIENDQESFNLKHTPIPITTEILTDWCGWNEDEIKVYKPIHAKGVNKIIIAFSKFQRDVELRQYGEFITALPHVKHLHQLQSLYQLLTGEEMPINLPKE